MFLPRFNWLKDTYAPSSGLDYIFYVRPSRSSKDSRDFSKEDLVASKEKCLKTTTWLLPNSSDWKYNYTSFYVTLITGYVALATFDLRLATCYQPTWSNRGHQIEVIKVMPSPQLRHHVEGDLPWPKRGATICCSSLPK